MSSMTLRGLDEQLRHNLRMQAARHDRSMEAEAREILRAALTPSTGDWFSAARTAAAGATFTNEELDNLRDNDQPRAATFDDEKIAS